MEVMVGKNFCQTKNSSSFQNIPKTTSLIKFLENKRKSETQSKMRRNHSEFISTNEFGGKEGKYSKYRIISSSHSNGELKKLLKIKSSHLKRRLPISEQNEQALFNDDKGSPPTQTNFKKSEPHPQEEKGNNSTIKSILSSLFRINLGLTCTNGKQHIKNVLVEPTIILEQKNMNWRNEEEATKYEQNEKINKYTFKENMYRIQMHPHSTTNSKKRMLVTNPSKLNIFTVNQATSDLTKTQKEVLAIMNRKKHSKKKESNEKNHTNHGLIQKLLKNSKYSKRTMRSSHEREDTKNVLEKRKITKEQKTSKLSNIEKRRGNDSKDELGNLIKKGRELSIGNYERVLEKEREEEKLNNERTERMERMERSERRKEDEECRMINRKNSYLNSRHMLNHIIHTDSQIKNKMDKFLSILQSQPSSNLQNNPISMCSHLHRPKSISNFSHPRISIQSRPRTRGLPNDSYSLLHNSNLSYTYNYQSQYNYDDEGNRCENGGACAWRMFIDIPHKALTLLSFFFQTKNSYIIQLLKHFAHLTKTNSPLLKSNEQNVDQTQQLMFLLHQAKNKCK